jgi:predicted 2-oxoglutarate/Fe(II)-dependent dioxygenase YbiX
MAVPRSRTPTSLAHVASIQGAIKRGPPKTVKLKRLLHVSKTAHCGAHATDEAQAWRRRWPDATELHMSQPAPQQKIVPGDPLPRIALPGADGCIVDLGDQRLAGRTLLLWFADSVDAAWLDQLDRCLPALTAVDAAVCVVSRQPLPGSEAIPLRLIDAAAGLAAMLGATPPALVIGDARGRLHAVTGDVRPETALDIARALHAAQPEGRLAAQAPVLMVDGVLELALRQRLMAHWRAGSKLTDGVAAGSQAAFVADRAVKRRQDVVVDEIELYGALRERFGRRVLPEIRKAFNVRVTEMEAPRVGCYAATDGGWFRRHRDNTTKFTAHRLFAMSLNLNTGDYDGGEVRFPEYGRLLYNPPAGGAVVFSCSLLHEALPVIRGERFGVFTFFHDEAGEARVRALHEAERAAGRDGHPMRGQR